MSIGCLLQTPQDGVAVRNRSKYSVVGTAFGALVWDLSEQSMAQAASVCLNVVVQSGCS